MYRRSVQLSPRYDSPGVLRFDLRLGDPSVPLIRQRRRLGEALAELSADDWSAPSRCDAWSVKDVVAHLVGTNQFWTLSVTSALAGSPSRFLEGFDPVTTPAALVDATRDTPPAEVLDGYLASLDDLAAAVQDVPDESWSLPGEAPPGHIELRGVTLHALWDAWTHERDILLPLGATQASEPDEIRGSLLYVAAISPAFLAMTGSSRPGVLGVSATDPDTSFVVEAGSTVVVRDPSPAEVLDAELRGDAVSLIEGLTFRAPLTHDVPPEHEWLLGGLAQVFDVVGS